MIINYEILPCLKQATYHKPKPSPSLSLRTIPILTSNPTTATYPPLSQNSASLPNLRLFTKPPPLYQTSASIPNLRLYTKPSPLFQTFASLLHCTSPSTFPSFPLRKSPCPTSSSYSYTNSFPPLPATSPGVPSKYHHPVLHQLLPSLVPPFQTPLTKLRPVHTLPYHLLPQRAPIPSSHQCTSPESNGCPKSKIK